MINNKDADNFNFGTDDSYQDNYESMSGDEFESDFNSEDLFSNGNNGLFGDENQQGFQQSYPQQNYQQQQYQQQMQQGYQNQAQYQQQYQQQTQQQASSNPALDNFREQVGKVVEKGGIKLSNAQAGILLIVGLVILVIICVGIYSAVSAPKKPKVSTNQTVVTQTAPTTSNKSTATTQSTTNGLNLIVVGDNVPIDYSAANLETTGLVTNKITYVADNQVFYCLEISMTVGSGTKTVKQFCARKTFKAIDTGTVVNVTYQQLDEHNIAVYDITVG